MNCSDQNRLWKGKWKEACARKWFLTLSNCGFWLAPAPNYPFLQMSTPIGESVKWCRIWISFIECRNPFLIRASSKQNASQVWKRNYIVQICHDFFFFKSKKSIFKFHCFQMKFKKELKILKFHCFQMKFIKRIEDAAGVSAESSASSNQFNTSQFRIQLGSYISTLFLLYIPITISLNINIPFCLAYFYKSNSTDKISQL